MANLKIFTQNIEPEATNQIYTLISQPAFADCKVRIMPDVHAGAGRIMSRSKARSSIALEDFEDSMKGIYSTTVNKSTLDESPMAYKSIDEILENIKETVDVIEVIKPIYNFKASE